MWAGVFPDCGCYYTTDDDGIHYCPLHDAAAELLKLLKELTALESPAWEPIDRIGGLPLTALRADLRARCREAIRRAEAEPSKPPLYP